MSEKLSKDREWMDGRRAFLFPEALVSNVMKRNIVRTAEKHDSLTRTHVRTTLARRALSSMDIEREIAGFREWEANQRGSMDAEPEL